MIGTDRPTRPRSSSALLICLTLLSTLLAACSGTAQSRTYTIGVVNESRGLVAIVEDFKAAMATLGYVEGKNTIYISHDVIGTDPEKNEIEVKSLLEQKLDLLLVLGTAPAKAAKKLTAGMDLPVVFVPLVNPVEEGIVASISHPGGNLTGVQNVNSAPKALEWLLTIAPDTKQVYIPYSAADQVALRSIKLLPDLAAKLGVKLTPDAISSKDQGLAAIRALPEGSAVLFVPSPTINPFVAELRKLAVERRILGGAAHPIRGGTPTDMVFTYATDSVAQSKQTAVMVDKIFKGAKPADLPVETPELFLTINLQTANAIGLNIPDKILKQASTVIR